MPSNDQTNKVNELKQTLTDAFKKVQEELASNMTPILNEKPEQAANRLIENYSKAFGNHMAEPIANYVVDIVNLSIEQTTANINGWVWDVTFIPPNDVLNNSSPPSGLNNTISNI